jgi:hypothetical protein
MNRFFRDYPAFGVGIISALVSLVGVLLTMLLSIGYGHAMSRFDEIKGDSRQNLEEHQQLKDSITRLEGRMIRVETLIVNGHGDKDEG